jgi:lipoprotein-anchoring transpeptidase ErfK/SrfK
MALRLRLPSACAALAALVVLGVAAPSAPAAVDWSAERTLSARKQLEAMGADGRTHLLDSTYYLARVRADGLQAFRSPGGSYETWLDPRTDIGSRRVLGVVAVSGPWLGVTAVEARNGKLTWIDSRSESIDLVPTEISIRIDRSRRMLTLLSGNQVVRRAPVGVGRRGSPTPIGHFSVTDKLNGRRYGSSYGCCILALSGNQPNLPRGWRGQGRLAIHGTNAPGSIGRRSSAGCARASRRTMRLLMRRVPLGTPVEITR